MKKRIIMKGLALVALLVVGASPLIGQFSYTYTPSESLRYDSSTGTLYLTSMINGTSSMPNPGIGYHQPWTDQVGFTNGDGGPIIGTPQSFQGSHYATNAQMNYSHTFPLDLETNCSLSFLDAGDCFIEEQPKIWCASSVAFFIRWPKKFQFEDAYTFTIATGDAGGGYLTQSTDCNNAPSQPVDWPGESVIVDSGGGINSGYIQSALMYRTAKLGTSFSGGWTKLFDYGWTRRNVNTPGPCTSHDGNPPITGAP